jgi:oxygen-independent coproporphyrinogen-3 oxidase
MRPATSTEIPDPLLARLDVAGPRYTSYPTVPEWSEHFGERDYALALARASARPSEPLSLYLHIPFCRAMCSYCGCNVVATRDQTRADRYLDAIAAEATMVAERLGARRTVSRLHLGGGTPTFLDERQLWRLWDVVTDHFTLLPDAEVAVEIDPVVTTASQIALLARFGFNRLSMGVQDFDPRVQSAIHRIQTVEQTRAIVLDARAEGFRSVNFDLIYGLPRQTPESWRRTLEQVVELGPDRVAAFSFAFVPSVKPHQRRLPLSDLPLGRAKLELFLIAHEALTTAGYRAIGMDHFALAGDELAVAQRDGTLWRDFQGYTTQRARDTVALGASGIGDVGGAYCQSARLPNDYERLIAERHLPTVRGLERSRDDDLRRAIITQLMCNLRVDLGAGAREKFAAELETLRGFQRDGLVILDASRVTVTEIGRLFVRNLAMAFDAHLRTVAAPAFSRTV